MGGPTITNVKKSLRELTMNTSFKQNIYGIFTAAMLMGTSMQLSATDFSGDAYGVTAHNAPAGAISIRLGGPGGFSAESDSLSYSSFYPMPDGSYRYEVTGALPSTRGAVAYDSKDAMHNGRASTRGAVGARTGVVDAGHFRLQQGAVIMPDPTVVEE